MIRRRFNITDLSGVIHDRLSNKTDSVGQGFTIASIVEALLGFAEPGVLQVSFANGSAPGVVHLTPQGAPYKSEEAAAEAAQTLVDLQSIHYAIVTIDDGWGIRDVTAEFGDWFTYWADKDKRTDDDGNITAEDLETLGNTLLVSQDDWGRFEKGDDFQEWLRDNAPPTREQVEGYWPRATKPIPVGTQMQEIEPTTKKHPPGEPRTKTIDGWKKDYKTVEHLMAAHKCGPTSAAKKAHVPGGRSVDAMERGWRHYKKHLSQTAKRQSGKAATIPIINSCRP